MGSVGKFLLDWLWGKIVPIVVNFLKDLVKKKKIDSEVDKEFDEIENIKKKIKEYQEKHETKEIPPHLKDELMRASRKRVRGLQ